MARQTPGLPSTVVVSETREKMSDVALATRLVADASKGEFEQAIVVSNDADFVPAVLCVRWEFGLDVAVLNPVLRGRTQGDLESAAKYVKRLRKSHLIASTFPDELHDATGPFKKPTAW